MLVGAVIVAFVSAFVANVIIDMMDPVQTPGEYCGFGMAVGYLSILAGGFLGTVGGAVLAVKRPLYKAESH